MRWTAPKIRPTLLPALRRALQIVGLGLSATLSACAAGPESPTYDEDIRPLLVARCLRCHGEPGQVDPETEKTGLKGVGFLLDYKYFADIPNLAKAKLTGAAKYTRGPVGTIPRMPPAPAAALEDWEIEMLETWGKNPK